MLGEEKSPNEITLVGAGLAGSLLAVFLSRRGFNVNVYERRPDMRKVDIGGGRSINMALSARGIHALKQVGLADKVMAKTIPMQGRLMHAIDGERSFQPYGKDDTEVIYSISRAQLNMILMDEAESSARVKIHFSTRCKGLNVAKSQLKLVDENDQRESRVPVQTVIGTDGSASAIRSDMSKTGRFNLSQQYIEHGYKELTIPPGPDGTFLLEENALHIWPRRSYMLIALPNLDGSFTCTLFFPFCGEPSFESLDSEDRVVDFFATQFPDATPLMPNLLEDFFENPTGSLVTIKCNPWSVGGTAALLGDAAHAIVPFFGQGMNCSFEDCTYLDACLEKHGEDWPVVFAEFEKLRRVDTDAIADLALENFVEMRDHVADDKFLLKKEIEIALEGKFPTRFIPRYSMVSFHRIPYSVALRRGKIQANILNELGATIETVEDLDWERAEQLVSEKLPETAVQKDF